MKVLDNRAIEIIDALPDSDMAAFINLSENRHILDEFSKRRLDKLVEYFKDRGVSGLAVREYVQLSEKLASNSSAGSK